MTYWRMQLHPASRTNAIEYTIKSLAAGYIGLDFEPMIGDLFDTEQATLPVGQRDCWAFAHEMQEGDLVLIVAHHFPFALARVAGPYNYIRATVPEIGVWFRHFREVDDIRYYADFKTNAHDWEATTMTDTLSPLRRADTISYRLIEEWKGGTSTR
jgi:hypothetical protein